MRKYLPGGAGSKIIYSKSKSDGTTQLDGFVNNDGNNGKEKSNDEDAKNNGNQDKEDQEYGQYGSKVDNNAQENLTTSHLAPPSSNSSSVSLSSHVDAMLNTISYIKRSSALANLCRVR